MTSSGAEFWMGPVPRLFAAPPGLSAAGPVRRRSASDEFAVERAFGEEPQGGVDE